MKYNYMHLRDSKPFRDTSLSPEALEEIGDFCVLAATGNPQEKIYALDIIRTYNPFLRVGINRKPLVTEIYLSANPQKEGWDFVASIPEVLFSEQYIDKDLSTRQPDFL